MQTYDITVQLRVSARDETTLAEIISGVRNKAADLREQEDPQTAWWAESADANWTYVGDGLAAEQQASRRHVGVQYGDGNTQVNTFGSTR